MSTWVNFLSLFLVFSDWQNWRNCVRSSQELNRKIFTRKVFQFFSSTSNGNFFFLRDLLNSFDSTHHINKYISIYLIYDNVTRLSIFQTKMAEMLIFYLIWYGVLSTWLFIMQRKKKELYLLKSLFFRAREVLLFINI